MGEGRAGGLRIAGLHWRSSRRRVVAVSGWGGGGVGMGQPGVSV